MKIFILLFAFALAACGPQLDAVYSDERALVAWADLPKASCARADEPQPDMAPPPPSPPPPDKERDGIPDSV